MKLSELVESLNIYTFEEEYEIFYDQFLLNEGLIKTNPIDKTVSILKSNRIRCDKFKDENVFHVELTKKSPKTLDQILSLTNNLGWFPSYAYYILDSKQLNYENFNRTKVLDMLDSVDLILLRFEAKYDTIIGDVPKILYHVTTKEKASKILELGLSPKDGSMKAYHPDRIYLGFDPKSLEKMVHRSPEFWLKSRTGEFTILKIDTSLIPSYFRIFKDPNSKLFGCFTLNTIPPKAISIESKFKIQ